MIDYLTISPFNSPFSHFFFSSFLLLISLPFSHLFFSFPFFFFLSSSTNSFCSVWHFLLLFGSSLTKWSREEASFPFPHAICVALNLLSFFFYFFYCIIQHVANCVPHIQVHHMALSMCHSLGVSCGILLTMSCVIRHPTPRKTCNSNTLEIQRNLTW